MSAKRRRPSAVLVLGTLSGLLAGLMYTTISVPLVMVTLRQEEANALAQTAGAAETIERWLVSGTVLTEDKVSRLGVTRAQVTPVDSDVPLFQMGDVDALLGACASGEPPVTLDVARQSWAVTCIEVGGHRVLTARQPQYDVAREIVYWTVILAIVVGIVTALGQARLLQPLSEMARALERVGRGEQRERLSGTGLQELDILVDRINEAAENVEERVDSITARITVVQEMARIVAHEIRNPLQSLELLTTLVASEEDPEEREAIASSIREEIRTLDQVVQRLLREGAGTGALRLRRRPESIARLLERAVTLHRPAAQRQGIRISVGVLSREKADVDAAMLSRSIENLIVNALEAVPDRTGEVRLSLFRESDALVIACDDNGPGVPPHLGDRIFETNITGRDSGHGLGLALVKAVLVAHGGSIEHSTSPLGGARFLARIPLLESENP